MPQGRSAGSPPPALSPSGLGSPLPAHHCHSWRRQSRPVSAAWSPAKPRRESPCRTLGRRLGAAWLWLPKCLLSPEDALRTLLCLLPGESEKAAVGDKRGPKVLFFRMGKTRPGL